MIDILCQLINSRSGEETLCKYIKTQSSLCYSVHGRYSI